GSGSAPFIPPAGQAPLGSSLSRTSPSIHSSGPVGVAIGDMSRRPSVGLVGCRGCSDPVSSNAQTNGCDHTQCDHHGLNGQVRPPRPVTATTARRCRRQLTSPTNMQPTSSFIERRAESRGRYLRVHLAIVGQRSRRVLPCLLQTLPVCAG